MAGRAQGSPLLWGATPERARWPCPRATAEGKCHQLAPGLPVAWVMTLQFLFSFLPGTPFGAAADALSHRILKSLGSSRQGPSPLQVPQQQDKGHGPQLSWGPTTPADTGAFLLVPAPRPGSGCPAGDSPAPPPAPASPRARWLPRAIAYKGNVPAGLK